MTLELEYNGVVLQVPSGILLTIHRGMPQPIYEVRWQRRMRRAIRKGRYPR